MGKTTGLLREVSFCTGFLRENFPQKTLSRELSLNGTRSSSIQNTDVTGVLTVHVVPQYWISCLTDPSRSSLCVRSFSAPSLTPPPTPPPIMLPVGISPTKPAVEGREVLCLGKGLMSGSLKGERIKLPVLKKSWSVQLGEVVGIFAVLLLISIAPLQCIKNTVVGKNSLLCL